MTTTERSRHSRRPSAPPPAGCRTRRRSTVPLRTSRRLGTPSWRLRPSCRRLGEHGNGASACGFCPEHRWLSNSCRGQEVATRSGLPQQEEPTAIHWSHRTGSSRCSRRGGSRRFVIDPQGGRQAIQEGHLASALHWILLRHGLASYMQAGPVPCAAS